MHRLAYVVAVIVFACLLSLGMDTSDAGATEPRSLQTNSCENADHLNWVPGDYLCFAIKTFLPDEKVARPILRIYLHGDVSRGGPGDYMYRYAKRSHRYAADTSPGIVSVAMLRPSYYDKDGRQSTPGGSGRRGTKFPEDVDSIASAVRALSTHHNASRVVLIGHSGGAQISAVILGRYPGLADAALLAACPCDLKARAIRRNRRVGRALDPMDYADKIPPTVRIIAMTGARDRNTIASECEPYIARLKARGVSARLELIERAKHGFRRLARSSVYKEGLAELDKK